MEKAYIIYKNEKGHYMMKYCDQTMMIYKAQTAEAYTRWMGMHLRLSADMLYTLREVQKSGGPRIGYVEI